MSDEDWNGDEEHTADANDTKQVAVVVRRLVVFAAKVQIVMTQQCYAYNSQQLQEKTIEINKQIFHTASEKRSSQTNK